jgi:hypothetical protein
VDLDSLATWARVIVEKVGVIVEKAGVIVEKAALFKKVMPMAMENFSIAQHRDTLWYAHTQGGSYKPKVK